MPDPSTTDRSSPESPIEHAASQERAHWWNKGAQMERRVLMQAADHGRVVGMDFTERGDGLIVIHVAVNEDTRWGHEHVAVFRDLGPQENQ